MQNIIRDALIVIPARAGSKGIPNKNLRKINGHSLLGRTILTALQITDADNIVVSTDGDEIADEASRHGISVPFRRPDALSGDRSLSIDVWRHAWKTAEDIKSKLYNYSILLEPTSPMRTPSDLIKAYEALKKDTKAFATATVSPTPAHYTPHKTLEIAPNNHITFFMGEGAAQYSIRQKIPPFFHRNGICYCTKRKTLLEHNVIIEKNCIPIVINRPVVNIDTLEDLDYAEFIMNKYGDPLINYTVRNNG